MELILELLYEKRKSYVEWRQIIYAVFLALSFWGMYYYISVQAGYEMRSERETAALVNPYVSPDMETGRELLPGIFLAAERRTAEKTEPKQDALPAVHETAAETETADISAADSFGETGQAIVGSAKNRRRSGKVKKYKPKKAFGKAGRQMEQAESEMEETPMLPVADAVGDAGETEKPEGIIKVPEPIVSKEVSGFICNGEGHITGYADPSKFMRNSLVVLPRNSACTGVKKGAFKGLEEKIEEIYIPANIIYIEDGAFDALDNLIFIETHPLNSEFYSANGVLYNRDGSVAVYPNRIAQPDKHVQKKEQN